MEGVFSEVWPIRRVLRRLSGTYGPIMTLVLTAVEVERCSNSFASIYFIDSGLNGFNFTIGSQQFSDPFSHYGI